MKTFKEWLQSDRDAFFNDREFGDRVMINNQEVIALVSRKQETRSRSDVDYIYENHQREVEKLLIKQEDYALINSPIQGEKIYIDDSYYEISELHKGKDTCSMKVQAYK